MAAPTERVHLLLLPGMDGTEILYGPLLAHLPDWIAPTVVTYPTDGKNGYEDLYPLVAHAAEQLPACWVLGWSFSGPMALLLATRKPERVRGVLLAATFVRAPMRWLPWLRRIIRTPVFATFRFVRRLPIWLLRGTDDPLRRDKARIWNRVPARTLARRARALSRIDVRGELRSCPQHVLYLLSSRDRVVPDHNVDEIRRERPSVQVATIDGGHFALYSNPAQAARCIADFVRQQAANATPR